MDNVKRILFPVDLSEFSQKIVPFAQAMAKEFNAELHLLHITGVAEKFEAFYIPHPSLNQLEADLKISAGKKLEEFQQDYCQECAVAKGTVVCGDPADQILKYIDSEGIDLVVMGTHGLKGLERTLFGSVAEKIIRRSPVPVLSVNPYRKK